MTRLTISMPDQLSAYVEAQIAQGRYGNVSEYFRDLVRHDQERRASAAAELRALLREAESSGSSPLEMKDIIVQARLEARQQGLLGDDCASHLGARPARPLSVPRRLLPLRGRPLHRSARPPSKHGPRSPPLHRVTDFP